MGRAVRWAGRLGILAWALWLLPPAPAGSADPDSPEGEASGRPRVPLEQLLELPAGLEYETERRGGMTPGEWRARFRSLRAQLAREQQLLAAAQGELATIAGSADQWSVGPPIPGAGASDSPLDYRLRQEITRRKTEIERLERALRDLEVQANLANVPEAWRE